MNAQNAAGMYEISTILRFQLFTLQNRKSLKNHYGNFYVFLFIRFCSKSVLIYKI